MNIPDLHEKAQNELTPHQYTMWVCWVLSFLEGFTIRESRPAIHQALEDQIEGVKKVYPEGGEDQ